MAEAGADQVQAPAPATAEVDLQAMIAKALADPSAEMPPGARRMTEAERKQHVSNVTTALAKQVGAACVFLLA